MSSELYRPFTETSKWFFAPRGGASTTAFKIYRKNDPLADYRLYIERISGSMWDMALTALRKFGQAMKSAT